MYTFHLINKNKEYMHSDAETVPKDYNLHTAIINLKTFALANTGFDLLNEDYLLLKDALELAMVDEHDSMDTFSLVFEAYIASQILMNLDTEELRYLNLFRLFQFLINTKYTTEYASRVQIVRNIRSSSDVLVVNNLESDKGKSYKYSDVEYGYEFSFSTLEILNLQATSTVDTSLVASYVMALADDVPIEYMLKNNLFNYQTFSNSELVFSTMLNDIDDLETKVTKMTPLMECADYFFFTVDNVYETFNNYIDFSYLEVVIKFCIEHFKHYLDLIDSAKITTYADPLAFYPSGQEQLFAVMSATRRILAMLGILYNLALMFKNQYLISKELGRYEDSLNDVYNTQVTESIARGKLTSRFPDIDVDDLLYNKGGDSIQQDYMKELLEDSYHSLNNGMTNLGTIDDYVGIMRDTSSGYTSVISDGTESGLWLDDLSQRLIDNMESIIDKINILTAILNLIKGNTLPSFSFTLSLNMIIDLSFLDFLSQLITAFNKFMYNLNCLLNALACFASYIKDMYDTLSTFFNDEDKFDLSKYMVGSFTTSFNGKAKTVTTDMLLNNEAEILSILSDALPIDELAQIADALRYSINNIDSTCIMSWVEGLYQDALASAMASIKAGQRCKVTPGSRLSVDANLRFNLGLDIPDLRFQFQNCTGAM